MKKMLKKDLNCPYSLIDREYICEHKTAGLKQTNTKYLHNHDGYEIVLFLRGEVNIMIEPEIFKMKRGDMFFISPLVFHGLDLQDSSDYERIVINLQYEYLKKLGDDETDFSTLFQSAASPYMNHFIIPEDALLDFIETAERLHDCMDSTAFGHVALAKALIIELMLKANGYSSAERPQNKSSLIPPLVSKIFDYIESNINDDLKINKMAQDLHYSSDHLSRVFSEVTGDSLKHYINAKKWFWRKNYYFRTILLLTCVLCLGITTIPAFQGVLASRSEHHPNSSSYCTELDSLQCTGSFCVPLNRMVDIGIIINSCYKEKI